MQSTKSPSNLSQILLAARGVNKAKTFTFQSLMQQALRAKRKIGQWHTNWRLVFVIWQNKFETVTRLKPWIYSGRSLGWAFYQKKTTWAMWGFRTWIKTPIRVCETNCSVEVSLCLQLQYLFPLLKFLMAEILQKSQAS